MFNIGQQTAVQGAFKLAGYEGPLMTLRVDDPTERWFILSASDLTRLRDVDVLSQIVGQVLGCKAGIFEGRAEWEPYAPFE